MITSNLTIETSVDFDIQATDYHWIQQHSFAFHKEHPFYDEIIYYILY